MNKEQFEKKAEDLFKKYSYQGVYGGDLVIGENAFDCLIEELHKALTIPIVSESFSMEFVQYIAKEHYTLVNQIGKIHYWKNETSLRTSEQLLKVFKDSNG